MCYVIKVRIRVRMRVRMCAHVRNHIASRMCPYVLYTKAPYAYGVRTVHQGYSVRAHLGELLLRWGHVVFMMELVR